MQIILNRRWFLACICDGLSKECNDVKKQRLGTNTSFTLDTIWCGIWKRRRGQSSGDVSRLEWAQSLWISVFTQGFVGVGAMNLSESLHSSTQRSLSQSPNSNLDLLLS